MIKNLIKLTMSDLISKIKIKKEKKKKKSFSEKFLNFLQKGQKIIIFGLNISTKK